MIDMAMQRSRGFGFVTFENGSGGAQKAIEAQPINMFGKMVEVKLATPKSERDGGGGGGGGFGPGGQTPQNFHRKPVMVTTSTSGEYAGGRDTVRRRSVRRDGVSLDGMMAATPRTERDSRFRYWIIIIERNDNMMAKGDRRSDRGNK
jgi:hypothetical protein